MRRTMGRGDRRAPIPIKRPIDPDPARGPRRRWRFMTGKTRVTPRKEKMLEQEGSEGPPDRPPIDRSNDSVKALVRTAKKRGYVTHEQINSLMKEVNSEQTEDVLTMLNGISGRQ